MDIKALTSGLVALLIIVPAYGHDIYKCNVNGTLNFQEEKCDENSKPIQLKELAASLGTIDDKGNAEQDARHQESSIKERIRRHQKRIRNYSRKMQAELDALQNPTGDKAKKASKNARSSVRDQETSSQLKSIADSVDTSSIPEKMNAIVNKYRAFIEVEQFQITLLRQELELNRVLNKPSQ